MGPNEEDEPEAVLIRAWRPVDRGSGGCRSEWKAGNGQKITSGPGKLTKALALTEHDGKALWSEQLWIGIVGSMFPANPSSKVPGSD